MPKRSVKKRPKLSKPSVRRKSKKAPKPQTKTLAAWMQTRTEKQVEKQVPERAHAETLRDKPAAPSAVDKENVAAVLDNFPEQVLEASKLGKELMFSGIRNVVICGMGGSGLPGNIITSLISTRVPIFTIKDYTLPTYVDNYSLIFCISYSGNTEETLTAYDEARQKGARIVCITSGGELVAKAKENGMPVILVPQGLQPRMACGYQTIPVLNVLERCGLARSIDWQKVSDNLKKECKEIKKHAKELSQRIGKKIPLIYSATSFSAAAYKWKINFNENAKSHAFSNCFPEFNHNEINGYVNLNGEYVAVILRDRDDHPRIKKRMDIITGLIKSKGTDLIVVESQGSDGATRLFSTIWLGDWVSYYTALSLGVDPTPVKIIEDLKKALKE